MEAGRGEADEAVADVGGTLAEDVVAASED